MGVGEGVCRAPTEISGGIRPGSVLLHAQLGNHAAHDVGDVEESDGVVPGFDVGQAEVGAAPGSA